MGPNNVWDLKTNSRGTQTDLVAERSISECLTELKSTSEFQDFTYRLSKSYQDELCLLITRDRTLGLLGMPVDPITVCVTASGMCSLSVIFLPVQTTNIMQNGQISLRLFRSILRKLNGRAGFGFCPGLKEDFPKDFPFSSHGLEVLQQPFRRVQAKGCAVFYQCQKLRASVQPLGLELCSSCRKAVASCRSSLEDPDGKTLSGLKVPALQTTSTLGQGFSLENHQSTSEHSGDPCNGMMHSSAKRKTAAMDKEERMQGCVQSSDNFKLSSSVTESKMRKTHSRMLKRDPTSSSECHSSDRIPMSDPLSSGKTRVSNTVTTSQDAKTESSLSISSSQSRDVARRDVPLVPESCGVHRPVLSARIKPFRTLQSLLTETEADVQEIVVAEARTKRKPSESTSDVEMMPCLEPEPSGESSEAVLSPYGSPQPLCIDEDADVNEEPDLKRCCLRCSACHQEFTSPADLNGHLARCSQQGRGDHPVPSPVSGSMDTTKAKDACVAWMTDEARVAGSKMCPVCHQLFPSKPDLESHLVQKHGAKLHPCRYCGQKFALKSNLSAHLQRHRGAADLECKECGARFVGKKAFAAHIRRHMGSHPYFCTLCSRFFGNNGSYEKHMERHKMRRPVSMLAGSDRMVHGILGKAKRCLEEKVQMILPHSTSTEGDGRQPAIGNFCENQKDQEDDKGESTKRKDCTLVDSVGNVRNVVPNHTEELSRSSLPKPNSCTSVSAQDSCHVFTPSGLSAEHGIAASANLQLLSAVSLAQAELDGSISSGGSQRDACQRDPRDLEKVAGETAYHAFVGTSGSNLSKSPLTPSEPRSHSQVIVSLTKHETEQMIQLGESGGRVVLENLPLSLKERIQQAVSMGEGSKVSSKQEESASGSSLAGSKASATFLRDNNSASGFSSNFDDKGRRHEGGLLFKEQDLEKNMPKEKAASGELGLSANKHQSELLQRLVAPPLVAMEVQEGRQTAQGVTRLCKPANSCGPQDEGCKLSMTKAASNLNQPPESGGQDKDTEGKAGGLPQGKQLADPREKQKAMVRKLLAQVLQNRQWAGNQEGTSLPGEIKISRHELEVMLAGVNVTSGTASPGLSGFRQPLAGSIQAGQRFRPPCGPSPVGLRMSTPFTAMRPLGQPTGPTVGLAVHSPRRVGAEEMPRCPSQVVDGTSIKTSKPSDKHPLLSCSNLSAGMADERGHSAASVSANSQAPSQTSPSLSPQPSPSSVPQASTFGAGSILEQMMKLESMMPQSAKEFLPSTAPRKTSPSPSLQSYASLFPSLEKSVSDVPACKRGKKAGKNWELRAALSSQEKPGARDTGSQGSDRDSKQNRWSGGLVKEKSNRVAMMVPPSEIDRLLNFAKHGASPVPSDDSSSSQTSPQSPNARSQPSPSHCFAGVTSLSSGTTVPSPVTLALGLSSVPASPSSLATTVPSRQTTPTNRSSASLPGSPRPVSMPMPPLIPAVEAFGPPQVPAWLLNAQIPSSSSSSLDGGDAAPIDLTKPDKRPQQDLSPVAVNESQCARDRLVSPQRSGILTQVLTRPASNGQGEKERDGGTGRTYAELTGHAKRSSASVTNEGVAMSPSFPHPHAVTMPQGGLVLHPAPAANAHTRALPLSSIRTPLPHEDEAAVQGQVSPRGVDPQQRSLQHPLLTAQSIASQNVCLSQNGMSPAGLEPPQTLMHPQIMSASQNPVRSPLTAQHQNVSPVVTNASSTHNSAAHNVRFLGAPQTTVIVPNFLLEPSPFPRNVPGSGKTDADPTHGTPFGGFQWHRPQMSEVVEGNHAEYQERNCHSSNKISERESLGQLREALLRNANKQNGSNAGSSSRTCPSAASSYHDQAAEPRARLTEEADRTSEWRRNFINALHQTRRLRPQQPLPLQSAQEQEVHPRRTGTRQPRGRKRASEKRPHPETAETQQQAVPSVLQQEDCWTAGGEGRAASERRYVLALDHVPNEAGVLPPAAVPRGSNSQGRSSSALQNIASSADPPVLTQIIEQVNKSGQAQPSDLRQMGDKFTDEIPREDAAEEPYVKAELADDFVRCTSCGKCFYSEEAILEHECDSP